MTEKRFCVEKQIFDGYCITDNHFKGYYAYEKQDLEKLCENLNDLYDENKQLKKQNQLLYEEIVFLKRFIEKHRFKVKLENHSNELVE